MPVLRATLEAVMSSQEKLRLHLDELISNNQIIRTEIERATLMREISYSTLGFGSDIIIKFPLPNSPGKSAIQKDIETTIRWLSYQKCSTVQVPDILMGTTTATRPVEIGKIWECIRDNLFSVYPIALQHACQMSKEQEGQRKAAGYNIMDKNP